MFILDNSIGQNLLIYKIKLPLAPTLKNPTECLQFRYTSAQYYGLHNCRQTVKDQIKYNNARVLC